MYFVPYQIISETTPSHKQAGICRNMTHRYVNYCLKNRNPLLCLSAKFTI